jgi:hypothetical protein
MTRATQKEDSKALSVFLRGIRKYLLKDIVALRHNWLFGFFWFILSRFFCSDTLEFSQNFGASGRSDGIRDLKTREH